MNNDYGLYSVYRVYIYTSNSNTILVCLPGVQKKKNTDLLLLTYLFIYLWLHWVFVAACGLFSSCSERGLLFVAVCELLIAVASLVAEQGL